MRDRIYGRITSIMGDLNLINDECCEMLFDIFAKTIEGLPLRKSLML